MQIISIKTTLTLILTLAFLVLALITENVLDSRLFAIVALCLGLYVSQLLADKKHLSE
jgi:hypothetical protein